MPGRLPSEFIQELLSRVDIVGVIQNHVPLKKYGREYRACCPFHTERTPSFYVSPQKQFYHCFGCGESGTAISFLMKYSNLRFLDAIEELATLARMEVPVNRTASSKLENTTGLIQLMEQAQAAYQRELLQSDPDSEIKSYIKNRQLTKSSVMHFGIGFAPDRWDFILRKLGRSKSDRDLLLKTGLVIRKNEDKEYDRFRNRLMFPIYDRRGRVIAFGGRVLDSGEPKYMNSPETVLFRKSNELFGLFHAAKAIRDEGRAIIVEGYTDVLCLHQFGIENAVATLGTATTPYHVRELFRTTDEIVFCFDGDRAGKIAAWRAMKSTLSMMYDGRLVGFVFLPAGHDPDSFVRQHGADEFRNQISKCEPIAEFIFRELIDSVDLNRADGKAKLVKEITPVLSELPDSTLRELMKNELRDITGLGDEYLREKIAPRVSHRRQVQIQLDQRDLTNRALALLIQNPEFSQFVEQVEHLIEFKRGQNTRLLVEVLSKLKANPNLTTAALIEEYRDTNSFELVRTFADLDHLVPGNGLENEFVGIILKIEKLGNRHKMRSKISNLMKEDRSSLEDAARIQELLIESRKAKTKSFN